MQLTKENFLIFAARYYDNPFCLTTEEFKSDVFKASVIRKMLTAYALDKASNTKMLINTVISFFNVFDHHAAKELLKFKLDEEQYMLINAILEFLSYPVIDGYGMDETYYSKIVEVYK